LRMDGLTEGSIDMDELFSLPSNFWLEECDELETYFSQQVGKSLPEEITQELSLLRERIGKQGV